MTRKAFASAAGITGHACVVLLAFVQAAQGAGAAENTLKELPDCALEQAGAGLRGDRHGLLHAEAAHKCVQDLASRAALQKSSASIVATGSTAVGAIVYCGADCDAALGAGDCRDCIATALHLRDVYCAVGTVNATVVLESCAIATSTADLHHVAAIVDGAVRSRSALPQIANANANANVEANANGHRMDDIDAADANAEQGASLDEIDEADAEANNVDGDGARARAQENSAAAAHLDGADADVHIGGRKALAIRNSNFEQANKAANQYANDNEVNANANVSENAKYLDHADMVAKLNAAVDAKLNRKDAVLDARFENAELNDADSAKKMEAADANTKGNANGATAAENIDMAHDHANLEDEASNIVDNEVDFDVAHANTANLDGVKTEKNLQGADATTNLNDANADANLNDANADGNLNEANAGANLNEANAVANLHGANLNDANAGANLNGASLNDANANANLNDANADAHPDIANGDGANTNGLKNDADLHVANANTMNALNDGKVSSEENL